MGIKVGNDTSSTMVTPATRDNPLLPIVGMMHSVRGTPSSNNFITKLVAVTAASATAGIADDSAPSCSMSDKIYVPKR